MTDPGQLMAMLTCCPMETCSNFHFSLVRMWRRVFSDPNWGLHYWGHSVLMELTNKHVHHHDRYLWVRFEPSHLLAQPGGAMLVLCLGCLMEWLPPQPQPQPDNTGVPDHYGNVICPCCHVWSVTMEKSTSPRDRFIIACCILGSVSSVVICTG